MASGLVGIPAACCCWYIGWFPALLALLLAAIGFARMKDDPNSDAKPLLIGGLVLGSLGLVIIVVVLVLMGIGNMPESYSTY